MSIGIIHPFEIVYVTHDQAEILLCLQRLVQKIMHTPPIVKPSQRVNACHIVKGDILTAQLQCNSLHIPHKDHSHHKQKHKIAYGIEYINQ